ncbi:hypothetical protein HYT24_00135 [Candidatus Pacearchaeota archaeon]|nr:hypothetical protein [Candidatus Pacearchaeota archaeon]
MKTEVPYVNYSEVKIGDIITDGNDIFAIVRASDVMYPDEYVIDCLVIYKLTSWETLEEIKKRNYSFHAEDRSLIVINHFGHSFGRLTEEQAKDFFKGKLRIERSIRLIAK